MTQLLIHTPIEDKVSLSGPSVFVQIIPKRTSKRQLKKIWYKRGFLLNLFIFPTNQIQV